MYVLKWSKFLILHSKVIETFGSLFEECNIVGLSDILIAIGMYMDAPTLKL
jgi:hypothetical protein